LRAERRVRQAAASPTSVARAAVMPSSASQLVGLAEPPFLVVLELPDCVPPAAVGLAVATVVVAGLVDGLLVAGLLVEGLLVASPASTGGVVAEVAVTVGFAAVVAGLADEPDFVPELALAVVADFVPLSAALLVAFRLRDAAGVRLVLVLVAELLRALVAARLRVVVDLARGVELADPPLREI
jgi:hypothetical protein